MKIKFKGKQYDTNNIKVIAELGLYDQTKESNRIGAAYLGRSKDGTWIVWEKCYGKVSIVGIARGFGAVMIKTFYDEDEE